MVMHGWQSEPTVGVVNFFEVVAVVTWSPQPQVLDVVWCSVAQCNCSCSCGCSCIVV